FAGGSRSRYHAENGRRSAALHLLAIAGAGPDRVTIGDWGHNADFQTDRAARVRDTESGGGKFWRTHCSQRACRSGIPGKTTRLATFAVAGSGRAEIQIFAACIA